MELPRLLPTANCILPNSQSLFHIRSHHHLTVLPLFNYSFNPVAVFFCDACDVAIFKCATRPKILVQLSCSWNLCSIESCICSQIMSGAWQSRIVHDNGESCLKITNCAWHSNQSCGDPSTLLPIEYWHHSRSVSTNTSRHNSETQLFWSSSQIEAE